VLIHVQVFEKELQQAVDAVDVAQQFHATYLEVDKQLSQYEYEGCTATTVYVWAQGGTLLLLLIIIIYFIIDSMYVSHDSHLLQLSGICSVLM
jgi:hypothetical protein